MDDWQRNGWWDVSVIKSKERGTLWSRREKVRADFTDFVEDAVLTDMHILFIHNADFSISFCRYYYHASRTNQWH
jgi:hypothetical protein